MVSKIYKITNDINSKVYVGKTTKTLEIRFKQHCLDMERNTSEKRPLYNAMKKYGKEHFHISLIEECPIELENEREQYWIGYYKGYEEGYNATLGGEGKIFYSREQIISLLQEGKNTKEVCSIIGCCEDVVRDIAKQFNIPIPRKLNDLGKEMQKSKIKIVQIDKSTNEHIQNFNSYADAARWLVSNNYAKVGSENGVRTHIGEVCNGKRKTAYGFKWQKLS